jgi:hypothetical protein
MTRAMSQPTVPEITVGLVEPGGEYRTGCETSGCGFNATLYYLDPRDSGQRFYCPKDLGPAVEAVCLRYYGGSST